MFAHECRVVKKKKKKKIPTLSLCGKLQNAWNTVGGKLQNVSCKTASVENCNKENSNHAPLSHESTDTL